MCCEGETCNEWIFAALFSPNVYSCRLIKRGNILFSPNQKGSEWKTIKDANALKSSLCSRSRLHFTCSWTNFSLFILWDKEGQRKIFLGSTFISLLCPDPANLCVFHSCRHKVPQREHMGMKCNCTIGCFGSSSAFLCFTACTAVSLISLDCNASWGLDLSLYLYLGTLLALS